MLFLTVCVLLLPCLVLGENTLYRADIFTSPAPGRILSEEASYIIWTFDLRQEYFYVRLARAGLGNERVVIVFEADEGPHWNALIADLTIRGFRVTFTPLMPCSYLAKDVLGVDVEYTESTELRQYDVIDLSELKFYDQGITREALFEEAKNHFLADQEILKETQATCYYNFGQLPITLMYFARMDDRKKQLGKMLKWTQLGTHASMQRHVMTRLDTSKL